MAEQRNPAVTAGSTPGARIAFERLRERTDELELLVSGLLAFALLSAPGHVFDAWAASEVHVEGMLTQALRFGFQVCSGLSYSLAFAFLIHLAVRAYWIALIGLKATFPDGIRWNRIPMTGELTQDYYRARIGSLDGTIDRADRVASMLFAMAVLMALTLVWVGVLAVAMILLSSATSHLLGVGDRMAMRILLACYSLFVLGSLLSWLGEQLYLRRRRQGKESPWLSRLAHGALRVYGVLMPQRLIMPVQLTLQSNLPSRGFMVVYVLVIMLAMVFGGVQVVNSQAFALFHSYEVVTGEVVGHGLESAHYESMRTHRDVLLRYPMIPSDQVASTHVRLFIPHRPDLDNPLARKRCPALPGGRNQASGDAATARALECLSRMWSVTLDGKPVPLDGFVPAERRDLGLRGLIGYVDLAGLAPGRHELRLAWNPGGGDKGAMRERRYRIPFWFTPGVDRPADAD